MKKGQEVKKEQNHCNTVKGINCGVCETEYRSSSMETSSQEGILYWHPKTGYFLVITVSLYMHQRSQGIQIIMLRDQGLKSFGCPHGDKIYIKKEVRTQEVYGESPEDCYAN